MARVAAGDRNAFALLVHRHQQTAWRIAFRYCRDTQTAQDLVQEAFLKAFKAANSYRPTAEFRTWFFRILVNVCLDAGRRRGEEPMGESEPMDPSGDLDEVDTRQQYALLHSAIDELPQRQKMAVLLRHFEGLSHEEIASVLDASPKAVERLLAKARESLAERIGPKP